MSTLDLKELYCLKKTKEKGILGAICVILVLVLETKAWYQNDTLNRVQLHGAAFLSYLTKSGAIH